MTEIEEFILTKSQNTEQTKKNYRTQYKSIRALLDNDINKSSENEILQAVKTLSNDNVSNEWTYLCLPFMIRQNKGYKTDLIQKRREQLKILRETHTQTQKAVKNETLPSMKTIQDFTKQLYKNKEYKKYIVNFLIINYGVRNKDVDCFIVSSSKDAKDDSINYLIVKSNEVEWRVNEYKTLQSYGVKKIIIKSKPFMEAIKSLPINAWLFTGTQERLNETGLATTIKRLLYGTGIEHLTEGDYFKIIMSDINTKPNTTQLLEYYSKTRGTDYATLLKYYDVSKKGEILPNDEM
jgi:hypothetical protein